MLQDDSATEVVLKAVDYGAIGVTISTLVGWMPGLAAILSVIWLTYRIRTQRAEMKLRELELKNLEKESQ